MGRSLAPPPTLWQTRYEHACEETDVADSGEAYFIVGGAGFIGSHFVDRLLGERNTSRVTIYDSLASGREWHFADHLEDQRFRFVRGDAKDLANLTASMRGHDTAIHLASNPDIAKAQADPTIDFYEGTLLTHQVTEAARQSGVKTILYASGSGVYGDLGATEAFEHHSVGLPISTYGASKFAGETLISAYCYMFDLRGRSFRFGNVVGPRQTHGVGFDFVRRLLVDPSKLDILGDGSQSKSYIHVDDVIDAVLAAHRNTSQAYDVYNVATGDYITVTEIADLVVELLGLVPGGVRFRYSGGDRGWKADVPIVRLSIDRIRATGWRCQRSSRQALSAAIQSMIEDARLGRL
jgi:UDP-glucose 4-epimerase